MKLVTGNSNLKLADGISKYVGLELSNCDVKRFADNEIFVEMKENVRGEDVFVIQSTSYPANDNLMELLIIIDTLRRASAKRITAVIPYYGYARQDRKPGPRTPITSKLVANMIDKAGANRVLTMDLHAGQIQGFFDIPTDNLFAAPVLVEDIKSKLTKDTPIIVSPDVGGVVRARAIAKQIDDLDLAIIDKRRPQANVTKVMNVIGDVSGKTCIMVDDIVDTAGTLCTAAEALKDEGASAVVCYITHAVFSGPAIERIQNSHIDRMVVTDTIPLSAAAQDCEKIHQLSLDRILAESIRRVSNEESISAMFR